MCLIIYIKQNCLPVPPGPLAAPYGPEGFSFTHLGYSAHPDWADVQTTLMGLTPASDSGLAIRDYVGFDPKVNVGFDPKVNVGFDPKR